MKPFVFRASAINAFSFVFFSLILAHGHPAIADEGMFPISEAGRMDLRAMGLELRADEIFSPGKISLIDGICKVNGCTGSFVSPSGLIITNHHCAYRAIQNASSAEKDYLENGFQAKTREMEIPAPGYTVRITQSFSDVSDQVLQAVTEKMSFVERTKAIDKRRKELEKADEDANPAIRAEVAEMFVGKTYVMFHYKFIKDVRLVFAPPASVGNFGGDVDNWEWPRHTGDFSFMRAYVAPDGSTAEYAEDNVPFQPKRFIQVAANGADEGDTVFLLGYPGRTARHKTAAFLDYEHRIRLPYVVNLYQWQIRTMEEASKADRAVALKHSSRIKGLANVEKRSRGQLKGLDRAGIVEKRRADEKKLQAYLSANPARATLLEDIENVYREMGESAAYEFEMLSLRSACRMLSFAFTIYDSAVERQKADLEREAPYMDRNWDLTSRRLMLSHKDLDVATDRQMLTGMLERLVALEPDHPGSQYLAKIFGTKMHEGWKSSIDTVVESRFAGSQLADAAFVESCLHKTPHELEQSDDAFLQMIIELYPEYLRLRELNKEREGRLSQLYGDLITAKSESLATSFVPDANSTLRMTIGKVEGYSPEDAVLKTPITTLQGVIDKTTGVDPFITPDRIVELHRSRDFGQFAHKKLEDVPVAILYSTDTTGGNSGSPVLNAKGQLVGVNFDRAFEATINDFAWNHKYSRSIGVDIRYALWITGKVYGADHLLAEMGVK